MREDIASAIRQRNPRAVLRLLIAGNPPTVRLGYKTETELWDFKRDCPHKAAKHDNAWAAVAADVLAFYNNRGGVIIFGIDDGFKFIGATEVLDTKLFNDKIRRYLPDNIFVEYYREYIQADQRYLGLALVPPRGPIPARFRADAPLVGAKREFVAGGSALRVADESRVYGPPDADEWIRKITAPITGQLYAVDHEQYRLLAPDYEHFIERKDLGSKVESSLSDDRVTTTSLTGVGGMGKTALATWVALRAYDEKRFDFIVSVTAKDRELTSTGIVGLESGLSTYEDLLDSVLEVLGFPDVIAAPLNDKEENVCSLLKMAKGLLYVDNLETVDDARVIRFLDELPFGTHALVTSRRARVRVSVRPIDIPRMSPPEAARYIESLLTLENFRHVAGLKAHEVALLAESWHGIPLAMRWALSRADSPAAVKREAESLAAGARPAQEILEFSFRRVFDGLNPVERRSLQTLAILQRPIPVEALIVATEATSADVIDTLDELLADSLVTRVFDEQRNDFTFTVLPVARAFIQQDLARQTGVQAQITRALNRWFEAKDVSDPDERIVVRELRQGKAADDAALVDLAVAAERRGDLDAAEKLFDQAVTRSPRSYRATRLAAEFHRHKKHDRIRALALYRQSAANAPAGGSDRGLIFREYGILLRDSGEPNAADLAIDALREAVVLSPRDPIAVSVLVALLAAKGRYREVITAAVPVLDSAGPKCLRAVVPVLEKSYQQLSEILELAKLRARFSEYCTS